jgi:hypothetical protein
MYRLCLLLHTLALGSLSLTIAISTSLYLYMGRYRFSWDHDLDDVERTCTCMSTFFCWLLAALRHPCTWSNPRRVVQLSCVAPAWIINHLFMPAQLNYVHVWFNRALCGAHLSQAECALNPFLRRGLSRSHSGTLYQPRCPMRLRTCVSMCNAAQSQHSPSLGNL